MGWFGRKDGKKEPTGAAAIRDRLEPTLREVTAFPELPTGAAAMRPRMPETQAIRKAMISKAQSVYDELHLAEKVEKEIHLLKTSLHLKPEDYAPHPRDFMERVLTTLGFKVRKPNHNQAGIVISW